MSLWAIPLNVKKTLYDKIVSGELTEEQFWDEFNTPVNSMKGCVAETVHIDQETQKFIGSNAMGIGQSLLSFQVCSILFDRLNQDAFASIVNELNNKGAIYYIQVNVEAYAQAKQGVKQSSNLSQTEIERINAERQTLEAQIAALKQQVRDINSSGAVTFTDRTKVAGLQRKITEAQTELNALPITSLGAATTTFGNVLNKKPAPSQIATDAIKAIRGATSGQSNTDLSSLVPEEQDGHKTVSLTPNSLMLSINVISS